MVPEEVKKWVGVIERVTSTSALIIIVLYLVWANTGERSEALHAAKASAEEAVRVSREIKMEMDGHTKTASEEWSISRMIFVQICFNTANTLEEMRQCQNYQ